MNKWKELLGSALPGIPEGVKLPDEADHSSPASTVA